MCENALISFKPLNLSIPNYCINPSYSSEKCRCVPLWAQSLRGGGGASKSINHNLYLSLEWPCKGPPSGTLMDLKKGNERWKLQVFLLFRIKWSWVWSFDLLNLAKVWEPHLLIFKLSVWETNTSRLLNKRSLERLIKMLKTLFSHLCLVKYAKAQNRYHFLLY